MSKEKKHLKAIHWSRPLGVFTMACIMLVMPAGADSPMDAGGMNPGDMQNRNDADQDCLSDFTPGWMMGDSNSWPGGSMMGGMMNGMMGMMNQGMMGGNNMVNTNSPFYIAPPHLTLDEVFDILHAYLNDLNDDNLEAHDIMIFDNHAYAQITEKDTDIGALEVLIDPQTKTVFPEMGPNMMWNLKYGMMAGFGGYGMMGRGNGMAGDASDMPGRESGMHSNTLTPEQAVEKAQDYLEEHFASSRLHADEHADPFYGYYTLHVNHDERPVGMLSVNSSTGQVWPHTWHGKLLEMSE